MGPPQTARSPRPARPARPPGMQGFRPYALQHDDENVESLLSERVWQPMAQLPNRRSEPCAVPSASPLSLRWSSSPSPAAGAMRFPSYRTRSGLRLSNVSGITVNTQIAARLSGMVHAARGTGSASPAAATGARPPRSRFVRAHCGTSYWAIYQKQLQLVQPADRPPRTVDARAGPGHRLQLAAAPTTRPSTAGSRPMPRRYGFYNLPSEPWHWSVNGH